MLPGSNVHLIIRRTLGAGMSDYLASRVRAAANIVIHEQTEIESLCGNQRLEEIILRNSATAIESRLPLRPCSSLSAPIRRPIGCRPTLRDANGYLLTGSDVVASGMARGDRAPCPLETTLPGVLAAGDIRSGSTKSVGFAVGDGSLAVTCAIVLDFAGAVRESRGWHVTS